MQPHEQHGFSHAPTLQEPKGGKKIKVTNSESQEIISLLLKSGLVDMLHSPSGEEEEKSFHSSVQLMESLL